MRAQILVHLKTRDPQAMSAETTLRTRLGFERSLSRLERAEYIELDLPEADAAGVERLLEETTLLANPNKHTTELILGDAGLPLDAPALLVTDIPAPAGQALSDRIHRELPELGPVRARRGVLWIPRLEVSTEDAPELLARMADGRTRTGGLLANPHCEAWEVHTGTLPAGTLLDREPA